MFAITSFFKNLYFGCRCFVHVPVQCW